MKIIIISILVVIVVLFVARLLFQFELLGRMAAMVALLHSDLLFTGTNATSNMTDWISAMNNNYKNNSIRNYPKFVPKGFVTYLFLSHILTSLA